VVTGGQDVGKTGQVADLGHGAVLVRETQQVEVGVRHHHVFGLPPDPAAHIHIAISPTGARRVHAQAHAGVLLLAGTATAAGDIERDRHEVALLEGLDISADLDHLAGDLMAQHQARLGGGAAPHHVLVGAADVGREDLEDHAVADFFAVRIFQFGEGNGSNFDQALLDVHDASVALHIDVSG
jgi:hypothetical protein